MGYKRQNFKKGQTLTAGAMNNIDVWLEYICGRELTAAAIVNGELVFTFKNGDTFNAGKVTNEEGATGNGISEVVMNDDYTLTFEFTDGTSYTTLILRGKDGKDGAPGVHVGTEAPTDGQTVWIDTDEEPEEEPEESGTKIDVVANVGQVIAVKAVGADSKPTEFEAVDLPKVTPPDFSANEGEEGYIKNRTHYIDENGIVHKLSNKFIDADWMATSEDFIDPSIVIPEQKVTSMWSNRQMDIQPGIIYDVHINGAVYPCEALNNGGGIILGNNTAMTLNDYPFCIYWAGGTATGGMFFYNNTLESPIYMKVTGHSYTVYNKLPEEFLPEGVVKTVNGSKPDEKGNVSVEIPEGGGIPYIVGNSTTAGKWTGECAEITEYYEGLTVLYKLNVAGASGGTTLDINGLGAVAVNRNASTAVTTIYPAGSVLMLTYSDGKWLTADYDANSKNTAGTSNKAATKMFLVGATSQTSSGTTTYTNSGVYIGTDNELYSNGKKVATEEDIPSGGGSGIDITAEVGQTIIVEEVDGNGKPTKWKAAEYQPRTHWSEEGIGTLVPNTVFHPIFDAQFQMFQYPLPEFGFEAGKSYTVIYDGVEYTGTAVAGTFSGLDVVTVGNTYLTTGVMTNEPFIVAKIPAINAMVVVCLTSQDTSEIHSIQINGEKTIYHTPAPEYAPNEYWVSFAYNGTDNAGKMVWLFRADWDELRAAIRERKNIYADCVMSGASISQLIIQKYMLGFANVVYTITENALYQDLLMFGVCHNSGNEAIGTVVYVYRWLDGTVTVSTEKLTKQPT